MSLFMMWSMTSRISVNEAFERDAKLMLYYYRSNVSYVIHFIWLLNY